MLQVYLVVGGWKSGGWTDSTETLVEGGSAWTLHSGTLPDGGFGDCGILNYNNILYLFGGEDWLEGRGYADRKRVQHSRDQRSATWYFLVLSKCYPLHILQGACYNANVKYCNITLLTR